MSEAHILRYLWEVNRELPGNRKQKEAILCRVETSVRDYVTEKPGTDYHAIKIRFGTPREIASSYVEEMETPELIKNLRIRRKIVCIVAAAAVAIVLLWAGVVSIALANSYNRANGYMTEQVVEVERTEQEGG